MKNRKKNKTKPWEKVENNEMKNVMKFYMKLH